MSQNEYSINLKFLKKKSLAFTMKSMNLLEEHFNRLSSIPPFEFNFYLILHWYLFIFNKSGLSYIQILLYVTWSHLCGSSYYKNLRRQLLWQSPKIGGKSGSAESGSNGCNPRAGQGSKQPGHHARRKPCSAGARYVHAPRQKGLQPIT